MSSSLSRNLNRELDILAYNRLILLTMKNLLPQGKRKRFLYSFIAFTVLASALSAFGDKGLLEAYRLKIDLSTIQGEQALLEETNARLIEETRLLKSDKKYIASIARNELGMIGRDETIYMLDDE